MSIDQKWDSMSISVTKAINKQARTEKKLEWTRWYSVQGGSNLQIEKIEIVLASFFEIIDRKLANASGLHCFEGIWNSYRCETHNNGTTIECGCTSFLPEISFVIIREWP